MTAALPPRVPQSSTGRTPGRTHPHGCGERSLQPLRCSKPSMEAWAQTPRSLESNTISWAFGPLCPHIATVPRSKSSTRWITLPKILRINWAVYPHIRLSPSNSTLRFSPGLWEGPPPPPSSWNSSGRVTGSPYYLLTSRLLQIRYYTVLAYFLLR